MSSIAEARTKSAAFFDFDGTLVDSTIAHYFRFFMRRKLGADTVRYRLWHLGFLTRCLGYLMLDRINREKLNEVFYRNYAGLDASELPHWADHCFRDFILPRCFNQARLCLDTHKQANRLTVLVTGSLDFIVAPFARDFGFDEVIAAKLIESKGVFTGELDGGAIGGNEKAKRMTQLAVNLNVDLESSHAYGDSVADLPMLELVGHAHVVNANGKLLRIAKARGWESHVWTRPQGKETDS